MRALLFFGLMVSLAGFALPRTPEEQARHDALWKLMGCEDALAAPRKKELNEVALYRYEYLQKRLAARTNRYQYLCLNEQLLIGVEFQPRKTGHAEVYMRVEDRPPTPSDRVSYEGFRAYFNGEQTLVPEFFYPGMKAPHGPDVELVHGFVMSTGLVRDSEKGDIIVSCMRKTETARAFWPRVLTTLFARN